MNDDPVANDDTATVAEDSSANPINVLANDNDGVDDGETLTIIGASITDPAHGTAALGTGVNAGKIVYTPDANYFGSDSFDYSISDGNGGTDTATVSITVTNVNDDPVANDDTATVAEDSSANPINVLANDNDGVDDGETLTIIGASITDPAHGTAALGTGVNAGKIVYTPDANYFGSDSFDYSISDGNGGTDTATVSITVTNVNDDPVANDDTATVAEDSSANPINVLANDNDGSTRRDPHGHGGLQPAQRHRHDHRRRHRRTSTRTTSGPTPSLTRFYDGNGGHRHRHGSSITVTNVNDDKLANDVRTVPITGATRSPIPPTAPPLLGTGVNAGATIGTTRRTPTTSAPTPSTTRSPTATAAPTPPRSRSRSRT